MTPPQTNPRSPLAVLGVLMIVTGLAVALGAVIATDSFNTSRAAQDQDNYHLRVVRTFAQQWGRIDLSDYRSATTPSYHLTLATVSRFISDDTRVIRAAGALFTIGLVMTLGLVLARTPVKASPLTGAALILPLACSLYVFSSGAWILPDNAGWWGVLGILVMVLLKPATPGNLCVVGLVLLVLVLCRQTHLWAAGLIWLWPWLDPAPSSSETVPAPGRRRLVLAAMAVIATVPAFLAVAAFVSLWHGLVPPIFQGGAFDPVLGKTSLKNSGGNPATPAFLLTLLGMFGVFFLGYAQRGISLLLARDRHTMVALCTSALIGLALALIPATSFSPELGRYTGFWAFAKALPALADRSLFISAGATAGGAILALLVASLRPRDALVSLTALVAFAAAQTAAFFAWQRYLEPFVLILLALMSARTTAEPSSAPWRLARILGPVVLSLLLGAITWRGLREAPARTDSPVTYAPPADRPQAQTHFGRVR